MGLLDDAIREHLELKRRRGADSSEVARQEQEAFGPPRRGDLEPEPAALDEPAAFAAADDAPRALQAVEDLPWEDDDEPVEPATRLHVPAERAPLQEPESVPEDEPEPIAAIEPEPEPDPEPRRGAVSARSLAEEDAQPTREFDAHELRAATEPPPRRPAGRAAADPSRGARGRAAAAARCAGRGRAGRGRPGRPRGDARVPPGDAGARPAVVRAAPAQGLRFLSTR